MCTCQVDFSTTCSLLPLPALFFICVFFKSCQYSTWMPTVIFGSQARRFSPSFPPSLVFPSCSPHAASWQGETHCFEPALTPSTDPLQRKQASCLVCLPAPSTLDGLQGLIPAAQSLSRLRSVGLGGASGKKESSAKGKKWPKRKRQLCAWETRSGVCVCMCACLFLFVKYCAALCFNERDSQRETLLSCGCTSWPKRMSSPLLASVRYRQMQKISRYWGCL